MRLGPGRRQLGKGRIAADELMQVLGALRDGRENAGERSRSRRAAQSPRRNARARRWAQGIIELVAQHADQFLPGRDFLPRQLAGQSA